LGSKILATLVRNDRLLVNSGMAASHTYIAAHGNAMG